MSAGSPSPDRPPATSPAVMRSPRSLDLELTSRCNLRCTYCYYFGNDAVHYQDLPTGEWLEFVDELGEAGVMSVLLGGGEPFMRTDLLEIVDAVVRNRMRFAMISNGALITDRAAAHIARTGRCDYVQVSVDGARPETHDVCRGAGSWAAALRGIETLRRNGVTATARITIHRHNVADLEATVRLLLDDLALPTVGTNAAGYLGTCRLNASGIQLSTDEREAAMRTLLRLADEFGDRLEATAGPLADARRWEGMLQARAGGTGETSGGGRLTGCGCPTHKMAVRADGSFIPCTMLAHQVLGRMNRDRLTEVWRSSPALRALRERVAIPLTTFDECRGCDLAQYCTGNCPALAYTLTGEIDRPSPDACLKVFLAAGGRLPADAGGTPPAGDPPAQAADAPPDPGPMHAAVDPAGAASAATPVPPLSNLYLYLTDGCNLACRHCWLSPARDAAGTRSTFLDPVTAEAAFDEALPLGLRSVKLTGGEPLLHPRFVDILRAADRRDLAVVVETNGVLLTTEIAAALAELPDREVSVSLDGVDAETHDRLRATPGSFAAAVGAVERLAAHGIAPQIIMSLTRRNIGQVETMVRLAETLGAASLKFNIIQPTGRGASLSAGGAGETGGGAVRSPGGAAADADTVPGVGELIELGHRVDTELSADTHLHLCFDYPPAFRALSRIARDGLSVCDLLGSLGVMADGHYALCGIGEHTAELVFGRVGRDPLATIWREHPLLAEVRGGMPRNLRGVCGRCLMRATCLGSCVAQTYYRTHELWEPFWFCERAMAEGLFPAGRLAIDRAEV